MTDTPLHDLLKQLHKTLEGSGPIGDADRALLQQLSADIQGALTRSGEPGEHTTLAERMRGAMTRFEVMHPDLSAALLQASKQLGDMGI